MLPIIVLFDFTSVRFAVGALVLAATCVGTNNAGQPLALHPRSIVQIAPTLSSVTTTFVSGTFPVFVTM